MRLLALQAASRHLYRQNLKAPDYPEGKPYVGFCDKISFFRGGTIFIDAVIRESRQFVRECKELSVTDIIREVTGNNWRDRDKDEVLSGDKISWTPFGSVTAVADDNDDGGIAGAL